MLPAFLRGLTSPISSPVTQATLVAPSLFVPASTSELGWSMSLKPLPPFRGMSGGGFRLNNDSPATSRASEESTSANKPEDIARKIWTETQWVNLSRQARDLGLPKLPFFDPETMLLSKEVNDKLWKQLVKLYRALGPEKAPFATPVMVEGGELKWFSYMGESKGQEAEIYDR